MPKREGLNVLALIRGGHRFVFLFDDDSHSLCALLKTIDSMADSPDFIVSYRDADILKKRALARKHGEGT